MAPRCGSAPSASALDEASDPISPPLRPLCRTPGPRRRPWAVLSPRVPGTHAIRECAERPRPACGPRASRGGWGFLPSKSVRPSLASEYGSFSLAPWSGPSFLFLVPWFMCCFYLQSCCALFCNSNSSTFTAELQLRNAYQILGKTFALYYFSFLPTFLSESPFPPFYILVTPRMVPRCFFVGLDVWSLYGVGPAGEARRRPYDAGAALPLPLRPPLTQDVAARRWRVESGAPGT